HKKRSLTGPFGAIIGMYSKNMRLMAKTDTTEKNPEGKYERWLNNVYKRGIFIGAVGALVGFTISFLVKGSSKISASLFGLLGGSIASDVYDYSNTKKIINRADDECKTLSNQVEKKENHIEMLMAERSTRPEEQKGQSR